MFSGQLIRRWQYKVSSVNKYNMSLSAYSTLRVRIDENRVAKTTSSQKIDS